VLRSGAPFNVPRTGGRSRPNTAGTSSRTSM
jgi:hypothetical protein